MNTLSQSRWDAIQTRHCQDHSPGATRSGGWSDSFLRSHGFTLVELLVVIGIIGVLASLLLPVLAKATAKGRQILCLQNHKQLAAAWTMYTHDNNDTVVRCSCISDAPDNWVQGYLNLWEPYNRDNTNTTFLRRSLLAPYMAQSVDVWHCPSDRATPIDTYYRPNFQKRPLARSVSMNGWLNTWLTTDEVLGFESKYKNIRKLSDMIDPTPSGTFVMLDERADSIGDGWFGVTMGVSGRLAEFWSVPAGYHSGACNISFADGHVETHKWVDPRTNPRMIRGVTPSWIKSPNNPDIRWLQEHATGLK